MAQLTSLTEPDFRFLFESGPGLYLVLSPDLTIVGVSNVYLDAMKASREQVLGCGLFELFPDHSNWRASLERVLANRVSHVMDTQKFSALFPVGEDFEERYLRPVNRPILGDDERVLYITHQLEDVTELVHVQQELTEREGQLKAITDELDAFLYSVSHDLRAPLRAINGFSSILQKKFADHLPEDARHYLNRIYLRGVEMQGMIDALLTLSRTGRQSFTRQRVSPAELLPKALRDLRSEQEGRQFELVIGDLPAFYGDAILLKQVYVCLLSNALKFTRTTEQARIEVGSQIIDGSVAYFVRDNGVGFDMDYADKLFRVFQRLHRPDEFEGVGVGLAILHRIIARHGGRAWAEAEVNKGATFYFALPNDVSEL
jgi:signal transduction histidine kinase